MFFLLSCCIASLELVGQLVFHTFEYTLNCLELLEMINSTTESKKLKKLRLSLVYTTLWAIWKTRNAIIFRNEERAIMIMVDISALTFNWINNRSNLCKKDWASWRMSPISNVFF